MNHNLFRVDNLITFGVDLIFDIYLRKNSYLYVKILIQYVILNVLGPIDEFVEAMYRLANIMKQQNSRETQVRGMRELEAINGEKGKILNEIINNSYIFQ